MLVLIASLMLVKIIVRARTYNDRDRYTEGRNVLVSGVLSNVPIRRVICTTRDHLNMQKSPKTGPAQIGPPKWVHFGVYILAHIYTCIKYKDILI